MAASRSLANLLYGGGSLYRVEKARKSTALASKTLA